MVAVIRAVEQFSKQGIFPVKGILSSTAAYNMPGLVWLLLPASLIFSDPRWIAMTTAIPLNLFAAFILFKLSSRFMHRNLALACVITYCLSPLTFEWSRSLWAQHYLGAFYIFIAYFLAGWAIDRKACHGAMAIIFIVYATMIHFSSLVLLGAWGVIWLLWRPPVRFSRILPALLVCAVLLTPYIYFETGRDFQDLKTFVVGKSLLNEHIPADNQSLEHSADTLSVTIKSWGVRAAQAPKALLQLLAANFVPIFWKGNTSDIFFGLNRCLLGIIFFGGIAALFISSIRTAAPYFRQIVYDKATVRFTGFVSLFDKKEQFHWMLLTVIIVPLFAIALMGYSQRTSFALPFFPFQCIVGFLLLQFVQSNLTYKAKPGRIISISIAVFLGVILSSGFCASILYATTDGHSPSLNEEKFLQKRISDFIIHDMKSTGLKRVSISYDVVEERQVWRFIPGFHSIDPVYHVGMEFDYFLEKHPGISLPQPVADGLRPYARYVIVFQEGVKRYDLSKYKKYDFEQFAVLIKRPSKALNTCAADGKQTEKIIRLYSTTGRKSAAIKLAKAFVLKGKQDWDMISILLENLSNCPGRKLRSQLAEAVAGANIPGELIMDGGRITGIGFTRDHWTSDGKPAYLIVKGLTDRPLIQELFLTCYADPKFLPLTTTIDDGTNKVVHIFKQAGRVRIQLPEILANEMGLFVVKTDTCGPPSGGRDKRKLGVRVSITD